MKPIPEWMTLLNWFFLVNQRPTALPVFIKTIFEWMTLLNWFSLVIKHALRDQCL